MTKKQNLYSLVTDQLIGVADCVLRNRSLSMSHSLSLPVVDKSMAARGLGVSLELELFVFLGAASCVLWLGLPLFLLFGNKGEKDLVDVDSYKYLYSTTSRKNKERQYFFFTGQF